MRDPWACGALARHPPNASRLPRTLRPPQLVRRHEELRLLYEKVRLQESTLQRGQAAYRDRLNEVRALKVKVRWRVGV